MESCRAAECQTPDQLLVGVVRLGHGIGQKRPGIDHWGRTSWPASQKASEPKQFSKGPVFMMAIVPLHRPLLPASALVGAIVVALADAIPAYESASREPRGAGQA